MRTSTRHQLKQDKFAETAADTYSWAILHRQNLIKIGVAAAVVLAVVIGTWTYLKYREQQASMALATAMRTYDAPLRSADTQSGATSFSSVQERAKAANAEFRKIAEKYSFTNSGRIALYYSGITSITTGDGSVAERDLKKVAGSGDKDLAALAKLALASYYRDANRDSDAIALYKELIDHPTRSVAKSTAQLEMASLYETKQPQEAAKIYDEIRKADPQGAAGQLATARLQSVK